MTRIQLFALMMPLAAAAMVGHCSTPKRLNGWTATWHEFCPNFGLGLVPWWRRRVT